MRLTSLFFVLLAVLGACSGQHPPSPDVLSTEVLRAVPSGSALTIRGDRALILGDDAAWIYEVSLSTGGIRRIPVRGADSSLFRIPKERKQDFEASALYHKGNKLYLVGFGSGSKPPMRDSLLLLPLDAPGEQQVFWAGTFYSELRARLKIDPGSWNIEGAAIERESLFLFNRGSNSVIRCRAQDAIDYVTGVTSTFPAVDARQLHLPRINGREGRVSGASAVGDGRILFCASVEDTDDWTKDGPVLGSFIGLYDPKTGKTSSVQLLADRAGKPLLEKLESVDLLRRNNEGSFDLIAIGDNDDGTTRLLRLRYHPAD